MKRLLAAGAPSIVRIGSVFRADESGRIHNPEFTMIEWYRLGFELEDVMQETAALVDALLGKADHRIVRYADLLATVGVATVAAPREALIAAAARAGLSGDFASWSRRALLDLLAAEAIARSGAGRLFVVDYPVEQAALARVVTRADGSAVAERFELIVDGIEIANGYRELLDPDTLAERMAADCAARASASRFVPEPDRRLLDAMRAGLPACAGVALGFDRLLMLSLGARSLDAVMPFRIDRA
jgi:lysyl-tRNA synthetase class 2